MSHTQKRFNDDQDDRIEPVRKVKRRRGQQPSFNERRADLQRGIEVKPMDWNAVLPANDNDGYRPEYG